MSVQFGEPPARAALAFIIITHVPVCLPACIHLLPEPSLRQLALFYDVIDV